MTSTPDDRVFAKTFGCTEFVAKAERLGDSRLYRALCALGPVHVSYEVQRGFRLRVPSSMGSGSDAIKHFYNERAERAELERKKQLISEVGT